MTTESTTSSSYSPTISPFCTSSASQIQNTATTSTPASSDSSPAISIQKEPLPKISTEESIKNMDTTLMTYAPAATTRTPTMSESSYTIMDSCFKATSIPAQAREDAVSHDKAAGQLPFPTVAQQPATHSPNSCCSSEGTDTAAANGRKRDYAEYASDSLPVEIDNILSLRKYPAFGGKCYRHSAHVYLKECSNTQRQLQDSLRSLPVAEQSKISDIWQAFASEPAEQRMLILQGIVNLCCIPQLSYLNKVVPQQLRVDFLAVAPPDISLKILSYLDARSLCVAAQVSRTWAALANDDILWHRMCAQHIDKVCKKCGWGLPLLDRSSRRVYEATARRALRLASSFAPLSARGTAGDSTSADGSDQHPRTRPFRPSDLPSVAAQQSSVPYVFTVPASNITADPATAAATMAAFASQPSNQQGRQLLPLPLPLQPANQQMIPVSSLINTTDLDVSLISSVCAPQEAMQLIQGPLASATASLANYSSFPAIRTSAASRYVANRDNESGNISDSSNHSNSSETQYGPGPSSSSHRSKRRPWKDIFAERQIIANNWRKFRCHESQIRAHADGILCVQFNEEFMITGSYDSKVHVWDAETFELVSELTGHTMPVRALEFDDCKLFSGSLDGTVKIWDYRNGTCIRTLQAFENGGVISLHHQRGTLVVGGESGVIRVYNIARMTSFTLSGHTDWVNSVRLYGENTLFSCSDDMLAKRWDLEQRRCVHTYSGHTHHVQSLHLSSRAPPLPRPSPRNAKGKNRVINEEDEQRPFMITGSLDSTMRVWDIETGECLNTIFGHVEGIWSMTFDSLRIVSGSNDGSVKVWDTSSHSCLHTFHTSSAAVNCVALSDTRVVVGDNDGNVRIYDFRNMRSLDTKPLPDTSAAN
ncbi:ubiquitin-binding SDF ubiquitin ligase complex subunit met30 [Coemansia sp. IMI 203386]|nr:ubiquitin-binding SDF ubiquitin ligase complex subunit met30 [Coemansia sp. IMI 203386]